MASALTLIGNLLIFAPYYFPHIGGVENYIEEFSTEMTRINKNLKILIFAPSIPKGESGKKKISSQIELVYYPAIELVRNYPVPAVWNVAFWRALIYIFNLKFVAVQSHTRFFFSSFFALCFAKIKGLSLIHVEHGSSYVVHSNKIIQAASRLYDLSIGKIVLKQSSINISISSSVKTFIGNFDSRPSPIIHRGLIFEKLGASISVSSRLEGDKVKLLSVGRLTKIKGFQNSIQAVISLPEELKDKIQYLIIGDGEEYSHLKKLTKSEKYIKMLGSLPREGTIKLMNESNIFIHASLPGGGLATTLLEAMASRCAVIATPFEGARDVLQDSNSAVLLDCASPLTIKNAIIELLNNPLHLETIAENAAITVQKNFSWEKACEKHSEIVHQLSSQISVRAELN